MPKTQPPTLRELYSIAKENGVRVRNLAQSLGRICDDLDTFFSEATPVPKKVVSKPVRRGRHRRRALTNTQVRDLRRRSRNGATYPELAARFRVSARTAWQANHAAGAYEGV